MEAITEARYSIAAVSKLTGISCHALRAWERRHGVPCPERTPSGHRRYDERQVRFVRVIADRLERGLPIGSVLEEFRDESGSIEVASAVARIPGPAEHPAAWLVDPLVAGRTEVGAARLAERTEGLEPARISESILVPALTEVGERWFRGECAIHQERCASGFLRQKLDSMIDEAQRANVEPAGLVLVGSTRGERHEGGSLAVCLLLELAGWRTINLGVDLPVSELRAAVARWRPAALGVSFVLSRNINKRFQELSSIRDVPVFVGGRSILNYQGLAQRNGLRPLPGGASGAIATMLDQFGHQPSPPRAQTGRRSG